MSEQQQQIIVYSFLLDRYVDLLPGFISENWSTVSEEQALWRFPAGWSIWVGRIPPRSDAAAVPGSAMFPPACCRTCLRLGGPDRKPAVHASLQMKSAQSVFFL